MKKLRSRLTSGSLCDASVRLRVTLLSAAVRPFNCQRQLIKAFMRAIDFAACCATIPAPPVQYNRMAPNCRAGAPNLQPASQTLICVTCGRLIPVNISSYQICLWLTLSACRGLCGTCGSFAVLLPCKEHPHPMPHWALHRGVLV
jgi:hypothetical protein